MSVSYFSFDPPERMMKPKRIRDYRFIIACWFSLAKLGPTWNGGAYLSKFGVSLLGCVTLRPCDMVCRIFNRGHYRFP